MNEQNLLWLSDDIFVPIEHLDYDGYPIQSELIGYTEHGEEIWINLT